MAHALIVDDDKHVVEMLGDVARMEGFTVACALSLKEARIELGRRQPDVLLADLLLPDGKGIDLLQELEKPDVTQVIVVTGNATVDSAVEALRAGASDYLEKPAPIDRVQAVLRNARKGAAAQQAIGELREELRRLGRFGKMLGSSPRMQTLYDQIARVAPTSATVLLVGESGTGKELAAQTVHELSRRAGRPLVAVNCAAMPATLLESELFGHEKGAFTGADKQHKGHFERADGATIFLDEITEMPMEAQVKLLRVLESRTVHRVGGTQPIGIDVRVICATNRDPERAVAEGKLREDLYYRINAFPIRLPPLRERDTDLEQLAQYFLDEQNRVENTSKAFSREALVRLYQHSWPGNVRELKNHVERAYIMADEVIDLGVSASETPAKTGDTTTITIRVGTTLEEVERRVTMATLAHCGHVKKKAAEILGVSLKTLYNRLETYNGKDGPSDGPGGPPPVPRALIAEDDETPDAVSGTGA